MAQCRVVVALTLFTAVTGLARSGATFAHVDQGHLRAPRAVAEPKSVSLRFHSSNNETTNETPSCAYDFPFVGAEVAKQLNLTDAIGRAFDENANTSQTGPSKCPDMTNKTYGEIHPECVVESCTNKTYGEITQEGAAQMFSDARVALKPNDTFFDFGSGRGKLVLNAAVLAGAKAIGVENSSLRYGSGCDVLKSLADADEMKKQTSSGNSTVRLELRNDDMLKTDLTAADVVYVASLCFEPALMLQLYSHFAQNLKPGARVVSLRRFPDVPAAWGDSVRLIYFAQLQVMMTGNDPSDPSPVFVYHAIM